MKKKIITIVGGGSSAHALIPFINSQHREINILTSRPNEWNKKVKVQWQNSQGNVIKAFTGNLSNKYSHPKYIIPNSDIIIFCMPVHKYRIALNNIAKFINKEKDVTIGTMYGQGGFNWMVKEIKQKFKLKRITTFAIGLIPWVCRIKEYGKIGITYGPKSLNIVTFDNIERFYTFEDIFHDMCYKWFGKGMFKISNNFISLTLSVDNQIIHPSRLFAMYQKNKGKWDNKDDVPLFYKDYDDYSAEILKALDDDYSSIRKKIIEFYKEHNFKYMLDYLSLERLSYNSANQNIKESFVSSQTLGTIKTPVIKKNNKWEINTNHRFFYDDIYYGLCIAKWIASSLKVNVYTIDSILRWAEVMLKDKLLDSNNNLIDNPLSGSPAIYGYKSINDIIE